MANCSISIYSRKSQFEHNFRNYFTPESPKTMQASDLHSITRKKIKLHYWEDS